MKRWRGAIATRHWHLIRPQDAGLTHLFDGWMNYGTFWNLYFQQISGMFQFKKGEPGFLGRESIYVTAGTEVWWPVTRHPFSGFQLQTREKWKALCQLSDSVSRGCQERVRRPIAHQQTVPNQEAPPPKRSIS